MFLKKAITILVIAAQLCSSLELEPIAKYDGQHSSKCIKQSKLTGTLVNDKIFTFGGCFPIPYMVDPENDLNMFGLDFNERFNTTDTVYSYGILQDSWTLETRAPLPINSAKFEVVDDDVYLFDVYAEPDRNRSGIWKYATDTKEWHNLGELPFIWRYELVSCEHDKIIYFAGNHDGELRNIIQRYDIRQDEWKKPLFLTEKLHINGMFCTKDSMRIMGQKTNIELEQLRASMNGDTFKKAEYLFYTSSYDDGKTVESGFNISLGYDVQGVSRGDWLYLLDPEKSSSTISKINVLTKEVVELGAIDHTLKSALFVPYQDRIAYLIGGRDDDIFSNRRKPVDKDELKTYNHKVKFNEDILISDEQQIVVEGH